MKIKAKPKFVDRLGANNKLYTSIEFSKLKRGKVVDLKEASAIKLISYGLAEEVKAKPKKAKKESK